MLESTTNQLTFDPEFVVGAQFWADYPERKVPDRTTWSVSDVESMQERLVALLLLLSAERLRLEGQFPEDACRTWYRCNVDFT